MDNKSMDGKVILNGLIEIYDNDFMCGYEGDDKKELQVIFLTLILQVTKYVNDFRYCSKPDCPCSPETHIKDLIKNHYEDIYEKLLGGQYGLSEVPLFHMRAFLKRFEEEK